ncbi:MAG: right-handed parallel beta-helix repeat-containing protein [Planctomyces sp.]
MVRRMSGFARSRICLFSTAFLAFCIFAILAVELVQAAESSTELRTSGSESSPPVKSSIGTGPSVADYPSIQAAIDANPATVLHVPSGEYRITEKIRIRGNGGGLQGPGVIIQTNAEHPIVEIEAASDVLLRDIHLTRPAESATTGFEGILAIDCRDLVIENVRITDNRTRSASIRLHRTQNCRISRCVIENYSRISIDDRTANTQLYGYAFHCIDGTGIGISESTGTLIEFNRVQENHLRPTKEIRDQYRLGHFAKKNSEKPPGMNPDVWAAEYVDNWHQGSAILVTSPAVTRNTRIVGNLILNAAQGIDLHCDHVTVSGNMVENAFVGMKAMHGSRNVLIIGNQFSKNDLWAIGLMPGATSKAGNTDGGSMIANNIISEFGYGDSNWVWGNTRSPLRFDRGQIESNPPLTDVLVQGNVIDSEGPPRFEYSVIIEHGDTAPKNLRFIGNMFTPGTSGVCNQSLP